MFYSDFHGLFLALSYKCNLKRFDKFSYLGLQINFCTGNYTWRAVPIDIMGKTTWSQFQQTFFMATKNTRPDFTWVNSFVKQSTFLGLLFLLKYSSQVKSRGCKKQSPQWLCCAVVARLGLSNYLFQWIINQ